MSVVIPKSLLFNGVNQRATSPNSEIFNVNNLTVETWVYLKVDTHNGFFFEKGAVNTQYSLFSEGVNLCFRTFFTTSSAYDSLYVTKAGAGFKVNTWNHVAATYDGETKKIYVNGILVGSKSASGIIRVNNSGQSIAAYGGYTGTPSYWLNGMVRDVRVWDYARSEEEIVRSMHKDLQGNEEGLLGLWKMAEGLGDVLHDSTPNGNHMGTVNSPTWSVDFERPSLVLTTYGDGTVVPRGTDYDVAFSITAQPSLVTEDLTTTKVKSEGQYDHFSTKVKKSNWLLVNEFNIKGLDTTNKAIGRSVAVSSTYSDSAGGAPSSAITNGTINTGGYRNGGWWAPRNGDQTPWLRIDLGSVMKVSKVRAYVNGSPTYKVKGSIDGSNFEELASVVGSGWQEVEFTAKNARYIRLDSFPYDNSYGYNVATVYEVEVYGPKADILILDGGAYKTYTPQGGWQQVSVTYPTEEMFNSQAITDLEVLGRNLEDMLSPLDDLGENFEIITRIGVSPTPLTVTVQAVPKVQYKYTAELTKPYTKLLLNSEWVSGNKDSFVTFAETNFVDEGAHAIVITAEDTVGNTVSDTVQIFLYNRPPTLSTRHKGLEVFADIDELDGDLYKVRATLNGEQVYPTDLTNTYSDYIGGTFNYSRLFFSNEVLIGQLNKLEVTAIDVYGGTTTKVLEFTAMYMGLMFSDMAGDYYSTDMGLVLKYLMTDPMMAGTSSLVHAIKLTNEYPFPVSNITLWQDERELKDVFIQLCKTDAPFIDEGTLTYTNKVLSPNDEIVFYTRVSSKPSAVNGGLFDIYVKADPV